MRITKDFLAGVMFAFFGAGTVVISSGYELGTVDQMGPGFFPMLIGGAVLLIGITLGVQAVTNPDSSEVVAHWEIRPFTFVLLAVCCFGLLIERAGLIASLAALIIVARLAGRDRGILELAALIAIVILIVVGIFVYGLQIPLKLFA